MPSGLEGHLYICGAHKFMQTQMLTHREIFPKKNLIYLDKSTGPQGIVIQCCRKCLINTLEKKKVDRKGRSDGLFRVTKKMTEGGSELDARQRWRGAFWHGSTSGGARGGWHLSIFGDLAVDLSMFGDLAVASGLSRRRKCRAPQHRENPGLKL